MSAEPNRCCAIADDFTRSEICNRDRESCLRASVDDGKFSRFDTGGTSLVSLTYGETIIGYSVVLIAANEAHLLNLTIAPDWQRKGHGRALLLHLASLAITEFASSFFLEVRPSNPGASTLYESLGFKAIGLRRNYYPAQAGREDAIVMELKL